MIGAIVSFFTGPLGRIGMYAIGGIIGTGAIVGIYLTWKHGIENAARLEFNSKQMEQVIKDQKDFIEVQRQISQAQQDIVSALNTQNEELNKKLSGVEDFLNSQAAVKGDRPSSQVLKETIRRLKK